MGTVRMRRTIGLMLAVLGCGALIWTTHKQWYIEVPATTHGEVLGEQPAESEALAALAELAVKGRAPKTGYTRAQFGNGWTSVRGCDTRNIILARDMTDIETNEHCQVVRGVLNDPYTGMVIAFARGPDTSQLVQIDHVVALSNAWQTGAQTLDEATRIALANDPLNLLAVDGASNQAKGDGDAATWLPPSKSFRCQYVARQIAIKQKYLLWVTPAEKEAMLRVLRVCPRQLLPIA